MKKLKRHPDSTSRVLKVLIMIGVFSLMFAVIVTLLAFYTGLCAVNKIEVSGNSYLTVDYIQQASGLTKGENLLTVNVKKVAKNLKNNNWVDSVTINRDLLHTVKININEREPVAIAGFNGALFLVDGKGYVITNEIPENFKNLPSVHGGEKHKLEIGKTVKDKSVKTAIELISAMPKRVRSTIALWNPFDGRGHVFNTNTGFQVVYGEAEEVEKKSEILEAIYIDIQSNKRKISYIDVRVTESPVTGN
ncbi:MAG: FtsQ-type POTRA domain-containing protein [Actinobacteria bacterium]|nr:FtsQ-type POTRA domain-containing protein [Actinomycetota bacterium]